MLRGDMTVPDPPFWVDPLAVAAVVAIIVLGFVVAIDLADDGIVDPSILALFLAMFGPLVPALIARSGKRK